MTLIDITLFCYVTLIAIVLAFLIRARRKDFDFLLRQDDDDRISLEKQIERQRTSWTRRFDDLHTRIDDLQQSTGGYWRTGRGDLLQIRDMTDDHLKNAIDFLIETNSQDTDAWVNLNAEMKRRIYGRKLANESLRTPRRGQTFASLAIGDKFEVKGVGTCTKVSDSQARSEFHTQLLDFKPGFEVWMHRGARRLS